jgi:protein disulfide-isomerase A6
LAVLALTLGFYEGNSPVIGLTSENYQQVNQGIWFVEYYASWCGHCRNMAPEWEKAASALQGIVQVAAIDAGAQKINVEGVQGFPTIRFLIDGKEK